MKKRSEQDLVKACIQYLTMIGCDVWRQNQGATKIGKRFVRFSHRKGISDIIGVAPGGLFIAVECKMPKGKATPDQLKFLESVRTHGGIGILAYSVDDVSDVMGEVVTDTSKIDGTDSP